MSNVETKSNRSDCPAKRGGFVCTREKGHRGRHVAKGIGGVVLRTWSDPKPKAAAPKFTTYAEGYQAALADIAVALADGGEEGVREWLANNLRPDAIAH